MATNIIPAVLSDIGIIKKNSTFRSGINIIVIPSIAIMAPLAPSAGVFVPRISDVNKAYAKLATIPDTKYNDKNLLVPILCSIRLPNMNNAYMLKNKCPVPPCRNIDVIKVYGLFNMSKGTKYSASVSPLNAFCARNIITFMITSIIAVP